MLRTTVVLAALAAVAVGLFEVPAQFLSEEALIVKYPLDSNAAFAPKCLSIPFQDCQAKFDQKLNFTVSLNWRNSSTLARRIKGMLGSENFQNYINVCQARQLFYGCLGDQYGACVNRYYLLKQSGADWKTVMQYIQLFEHLDFICNAGFELAQPNWVCISRVLAQNKTGLETCKNDFLTSGTSDHWQHLCEPNYVPKFAACVQNVFKENCGSPEVGWFGCQDTLVGFQRDCRNSVFRCHPI
ncbi:hypothetical protein L596_024193 [Steinernema carpocapsae]|uniref:DUF19 domain-containing protein n=1 Tax=Steinernema carpocapsae TaxID=34508 RepID=A0A4U5MG15_STECR|nr:hypothetical protein L596_024193 [Steinernema carpocapsae]